MKTFSYPNYSDSSPISPIYDLNKWTQTMRNIYVKVHLGAKKNDIVDEATRDWNASERREFLNWMSYYESGDYLKYKRAQKSYYVNDDINYFIPNPPNPKPAPPSPILTLNQPVSQIPPAHQPTSIDEKRKLIEDQRKRILGRLNSAEKLLSSHQGQIFAGPDFERLLSAIYELKKQIQTVNKITLSAQTCIDLITRQANILNKQGFSAASNFMIKLAQNTPGNFDFNLGEVPAGGSQPAGPGSMGGGGSLDNNTIPAQDLTAPPPALDSEESKKFEGLEGFKRNMLGGGFTDDISHAEEAEEDEVFVGDDDVLMDQEIIPNDTNDLVVEAQAMPPAPADVPADVAPVPTTATPPQDLEVNSPAPGGMQADQETGGPDVALKEQDTPTQPKNDFDALIDSVFANLTINDVIAKLESVNNIFRNREISRQLALVDVMLDRLGLATYFPTLSEATNKQLEANQYCLTRIEDILSKLRGAVKTEEIDLENPPPTTPGAESIKQNLEQSEQKDKQRKDMKRQLEDKQMAEKMKPAAEVEGVPQELAAQPTEVEAPAPAAPVPPAPVAPPVR